MSSITELLMGLGSQDASVRVPAEQMVNQAKEVDLAGFLLVLLAEFRDESKPTFARNMAGSLLKNSVALHLRDVAARHALEERWKSLPQEVRQRVKQEVLATLGSSTKDVRNVAANIIGNLSRIELPAGEWPDLITVIVGGCNSGNVQYQEAALTALGYICEEASEYSEVELALEPHSTTILSVVVNGMESTNDDVKYHATSALCNAMEFIHGNMQQEAQRSYLINALCTVAQTCTVERTRERAMESLVKVANLYYTTLPAYIGRLHEITTHAVYNDSEAVCLQAMQFWIAICEHERELREDGLASESLNYCMAGAKHIVDICLWAMVRQEESQTDDDWNTSIAGGKLLQNLSETIEDAILPHVMPFVYQNIESADWHKKEAALLAFGCVLTGPNPEHNQDTVAQAVPGLLALVRDGHEMVADTAGWVLTVVCEQFPDVFLAVPANLQALMNAIGPMMGGVGGAANSTSMATRAVHVVHNLALAYADDDDAAIQSVKQTNELSPYFTNIIQQLLLSVDQNQSPQLRQVAQESLNAVVDAAAVDCYSFLHLLLPELATRAQSRLAALQQGFGDKTENLMLVGLLCGSIGSIARKLQADFSSFLEPVMQLLTAIFQVLQREETVLDEAIILVGTLAHAVKGQLGAYLPAIMPAVRVALQNFSEPSLCQIACGTIGDIVITQAETFTPFAAPIIEILGQHLRNPQVERTLKCVFFSCLGDITLQTPVTVFAPFAAGFMELADAFFQQSRSMDVTGDFDAEEYRFSLWESLATFYTGVLQSCRGRAEIAGLTPYLNNILTFAIDSGTIAAKDQYDEVVVASLGVVGDIALAMKDGDPELRQRGKMALQSAGVSGLVDAASQLEKCREQANWVRRQLQNLSRA